MNTGLKRFALHHNSTLALISGLLLLNITMSNSSFAQPTPEEQQDPTRIESSLTDKEPAAIDPAQNSQSILFKDGEYAGKQLVVPGFANLPLRKKMLLYHLRNAASAGDEIAWLQNSEFGPVIRDALQLVWPYRQGLSEEARKGLEQYLFRLLANKSNYDHRSESKFIPQDFTESDLLNLLTKAETDWKQRKNKQKNRRRLKHPFFELLKAPYEKTKKSKYWQNFKSSLFDPNFKPYFRAAPDSTDPIGESQGQFYGEGVTLKSIYGPNATLDNLQEPEQQQWLKEYLQAHNIDEKSYLNPTGLASFPVIDRNNELAVLPVGLSGVYSDYYAEMIYHIDKAIPYAEPDEARMLEAYKRFFKSSDTQDREYAEVLWTRIGINNKNPLYFLMTLVETYGDILDQHATYEGMAMVPDISDESTRIQNILEKNLEYFESHLPIAEEFKKKPPFTLPSSQSGFLLFGFGAMGGTPARGVNLSNTDWIRAEEGSRSVEFMNVGVDINGPPESSAPFRAFFHPRYDIDKSNFKFDWNRSLHVNFHEILGHGSAQLAPGVSEKALSQYGPAVEEGRAEMIGLYHRGDYNLVHMGLLPPQSEEAFNHEVELLYVSFFIDHLKTFINLSDKTTHITQAHQLGRQIAFNSLVAAGALKIDFSDIKDAAGRFLYEIPQIQVADLSLTRKIIADTVRIYQDLKSTGDFAATQELINSTMASYDDLSRRLRQAFIHHMNYLKLPRYVTYLNQDMQLVRTESTSQKRKSYQKKSQAIPGTITDVVLVDLKDKVSSIEDLIEREFQLLIESEKKHEIFATSIGKKLVPPIARGINIQRTLMNLQHLRESNARLRELDENNTCPDLLK